MSTRLEATALWTWLDARDSKYSNKIVELRSQVEIWLSYIPHTFPHFTRHTVDHSDEIVAQVSYLLFHDGVADRPVLPDLSILEAYIVAAAAYLHDAGMVTSEADKEQILSSADWREWTAPGSLAADRLAAAEALRAGDTPPDRTVRNLLADRQVRYLIAEFVRRLHHERAAHVVSQHQSQLGRFAFDDPRLSSAISRVCVGHGLPHAQLDDPGEYPTETDILGTKVNLRLCAILLRLGDLLDLRTERACPLLLAAACPLPPESIAHWGQYARIKHMNTAPDRIELQAECESPDEHRVLRDWCKWIEDECQKARDLLSGSRRHRAWSPPDARLSGQRPTIVIAPSARARYRHIDWTFEIDNSAVIDLLVRDLYSARTMFVRELLQNALDATRCRVETETAHGRCAAMAPEEDSPRDDADDRYAVRISLKNTVVTNEHSSSQETRQVVTVEDRGIGMTEDIARRYLLQVGRSWYQSADFRKAYSFFPTSRFGVGFLSVFAVSSFVEVDTFQPEGTDGPLRIVLTGPRNYVLVERGARTEPGTSVSVRLSEPLAPGQLTELVRHWSRRVEFPVRVEEHGQTAVVHSERPTDFIAAVTDPQDPTNVIEVRQIPHSEEGVQGELYVLVTRREGETERWDRSTHWVEERAGRHPEAHLPELPGTLVCLNGISVGARGGSVFGTDSFRVDCRSTKIRPTLARNWYRGSGEESDRADPLLWLVTKWWAQALEEHLATLRYGSVKEEWTYKQDLAFRFRLGRFWDQQLMLPGYDEGKLRILSIDEIRAIDSVWFVSQATWGASDEEVPRSLGEQVPGLCIFADDAVLMSENYSSRVFAGREMTGFRLLDHGRYISTEWRRPQQGSTTTLTEVSPSLCQGVFLVPLPDQDSLAAYIPSAKRHYFWIALNAKNDLAKWCAEVITQQWTDRDLPLDSTAAKRLRKRLREVFDNYLQPDEAATEVNRFLDNWSGQQKLPSHLVVPPARLGSPVRPFLLPWSASRVMRAAQRRAIE
jgi:hypothetical protein